MCYRELHWPAHEVCGHHAAKTGGPFCHAFPDYWAQFLIDEPQAVAWAGFCRVVETGWRVVLHVPPTCSFVLQPVLRQALKRPSARCQWVLWQWGLLDVG